MQFRALICFFFVLLASNTPSGGAQVMKGAWVASVYNLNFPSKGGLSVETQKAQIREIVSTAARTGLNALMVQVRPECDALYPSRIEPWSRFLTGTQGANPGYDPLFYFIQEGNRQGIAIHAWINPYRAATNFAEPCAANHISRQLTGCVRRIGNSLWLDPGEPAVREHTVAVVRDILQRYAVAGVILDDYFYPYPGRAYPRGSFPDHSSFSKYGGGMEVDNWRRQNVNKLVQDLHQAIEETRPGALFGVSPFGIYSSGSPADVVVQLDQYRDLYADPVNWLQRGWVDYLSPQLYWRDKSAQSFSALLRWWRSSQVNPRGIAIYPSIALDHLGGSYGWPSSEIASQLAIEVMTKPRYSGGFVLWNVGALMENKKGVALVIAKDR
jgi:uncharacterized lipoprotein YddW (UPF0748 family)